MCDKLFDNGNGEMLDANEFVRKNVFDTEGWDSQIDCPECGKEANERNFDECLGGAINQVYTLDCSHCGHHECDQEFCHICESKYEEQIESNQSELETDFRDGERLPLHSEYLIEQVEQTGSVQPADWTYLKLALMKNPNAIQFSDIENIGISCTPKLFINLLVKKVLDIKFTRSLELKISQAKNELCQ